jgi:hypothetical protein
MALRRLKATSMHPRCDPQKPGCTIGLFGREDVAIAIGGKDLVRVARDHDVHIRKRGDAPRDVFRTVSGG